MKKQTKLLLLISSVLALGLIRWHLLTNYEVNSEEISEYDLIIQPQFEEVGFFSDDIAPVKLNNKWGYMDKKGKIVVELKFDDVYSFSEGVASVRIGDKWGYIDKKGNIIIKPQFDYADPFKEGLAKVGINDKFGYVGKKIY